MPTETTPKGFVEKILVDLVKNPDQVSVEETADEKGILLTITVAKEDLSIVIGRGGQTAQAMRTLVRVFAANTDSKTPIGVKIAG